MRRALLLASSLFALALAGACASSDEEKPRSDPSPPPSPPMPDAAIEAAPAEPEDSAVVFPRCSSSGWCKTDLPEADLVLKDIVPFATRAFAVAESATIGVKVLEWEASTDAWKYIDDGSQGEFGLGPYVGKMWAPSENEIYFTVAPSFVYRGTRIAPGAEWSWTRDRLADNAAGPAHTGHDHGQASYRQTNAPVPALGVWGAGSDDVYAWYSNSVFHRKSEDGGAPTWTAEYVAVDPDVSDEHLYFLAAGGTRGSVFFAGARARGVDGCPMLARKTVDGIVRVVDGVARTLASSPCTPRAGTLFVGASPGWFTDLQSLDEGEIVALKNRELVTLESSGADYGVVRSNTVTTGAMTSKPKAFYSFWWSSKEVWLSGYSHLVRGDTHDVDAGAVGFAISTVTLANVPLDVPIYRIRGTSETNLWAVGAGYALHKTTP